MEGKLAATTASRMADEKSGPGSTGPPPPVYEGLKDVEGHNM